MKVLDWILLIIFSLGGDFPTKEFQKTPMVDELFCVIEVQFYFQGLIYP